MTEPSLVVGAEPSSCAHYEPFGCGQDNHSNAPELTGRNQRR